MSAATFPRNSHGGSNEARQFHPVLATHRRHLLTSKRPIDLCGGHGNATVYVAASRRLTHISLRPYGHELFGQAAAQQAARGLGASSPLAAGESPAHHSPSARSVLRGVFVLSSHNIAGNWAGGASALPAPFYSRRA